MFSDIFIFRENLTIRHIILVMDVSIKRRAKRRCHSWYTRIKWWHLKDEKQSVFLQQKKLKEGCVKLYRSENATWNKMPLGELIGFGPS